MKTTKRFASQDAAQFSDIDTSANRSHRPDNNKAKSTRARTCVAGALAVSLMTTPALAGDLVVGLGADNIDTSDFSSAVAVQLEYHFDSIGTFARASWSPVVVLEFDEDDDLFVGGGIAGLWDVSQDWFVEASLAAGYYNAGSDGLDLGYDLEFRSLIGVGYKLTNETSISLAFDHISNAGLGDENPGRNAVFLRYRKSF